ncbi:MAG TPA: hypothetical protein DHV17_04365 [Chitinophagaceae bacterium]|nr:hypothetical protein [Chitinophagaceae bacterium]
MPWWIIFVYVTNHDMNTPNLFKYSIILSLFFATLQTHAQDQKKYAYQKADFMLMAGHGIGNIWKTYLKQVVNLPGITYDVRSAGPYSLAVEYAVSNRVSAGIHAGYSRITGKYEGYGDSFTDRLTIFSLLARANIHFLRHEKWDLYAGGGVGYVSSKYANTDSDSRDKPGKFGYSGQLGARYLWSSHWGVYAEAGYVGGSFFQLGMTVRL